MGGGGEYFKEGMKVMFFNIENVDLPAFAIGKLGNKLDPNTPTFNVVWEKPNIDPWDEHEGYFDKNPLILHPDRVKNEIVVREAVHEARLLIYAARIRQAASIDPRSIGIIDPETINEVRLEKYTLDPRELDIRKLINEYNRETSALIQQPANPKPDIFEIPADLYKEAKIRIKEHMKQVNHLEASMGMIPTLRNLIPEHYRLENIDPLLLWIHEQAEKEEGVPTAGVAAMPARTDEAAEGVSPRKGIPDMIDIPNPPQEPTTKEIGSPDDTKPTATNHQRHSDLGIMKALPHCQNIDDIAGNIRSSEFGKLKLKQF
jgi:hypothetical protein